MHPEDQVVCTVGEDLARELEMAAAAIPACDERRHYEDSTQLAIRDLVRGVNPKAFDELTGWLGRMLAKPPYFACLRGLRWDRGHHLCIAIHRALGRLVAGHYQPPRSKIVHELQVRTELPGRSGQMRGAESFHNDGGTRFEPPRFLGMVCVRPDPAGGGITRLLDAKRFRAHLERSGGFSLRAWAEQQKLPWRITDPPGEQRKCANLERLKQQLGWRHVDERGEGIVWRPILRGDEIFWRRDVFSQAFDLLDRRPSLQTVEAIEAIEEILDSIEDDDRFEMLAGDFLVSDNLRTLHARTSLSGDYASSHRTHLRCWVLWE